MAERKRRRTAPKKTLIAPLVMLVSGAAVGVMLWRFLMLESAPPGLRVVRPEGLSQSDRRALDRVLEGRRLQ